MDGCAVRRMSTHAGIGGIGEIISLDSNHSTVNCNAQPRGFTNWSLIKALTGLTFCKSRIYGASAEAPEDEQSCALLTNCYTDDDFTISAC